MKVIHFQRKPVSERYFSIENSFEAIRKELPHFGIEAIVVVCKYISQGFSKRLFNTLQAASYQADVFHITGDVHYLALFLPKEKTILTIHDCVFMKHSSKWARKVLKLFWLTLPSKKVSYITCISEKTKEEVLRYVKVDPSRIVVIPTVVNDSLFTESPLSFRAECPHILHIGTTPNKNLGRVITALHGLPCHLHIIGPLSEEDVQLLQIHHIQYTNEVGINNDRMAQKYKEADIVLFASTYEGFGMPILEAQLTGRPVITSQLAPMDDIAGNAACLVDPFDPISIRNGLELVIENAAFREELIQKGFQNAKRFSAQEVAGRYADLYRQLANKR